MDGSGSNLGSGSRGGQGLPPLPPRSFGSTNFVAQEQPFLHESGVPNTSFTGMSNAIDIPPMVPNPQNNHVSGDDVPQDQDPVSDPDLDSKAKVAVKRRAMNREYSMRYRLKQHIRTLQLEGQLKSLQAEIFEKSPMVQYYKALESYLVAENIRLKGKISEVSAILQFKQAEAEILTNEIEEQRMISAALSNRFAM